MSFQSQLVHRITTSRLQSGIGIQRSYQTNLTDYPCMIQPMSAEYSAKLDMVFGRSYNCFVTLGTDMKNGDKIVDQDGKEYRVSGSLKRNYGANSHITFYLTEEAGASNQ